MKKIIFALLTLCIVSLSYAETPVPELVKKNFVAQFPQASDITWIEQQNGLFEADFTWQQHHFAALLDNKGTMLHAGETLSWFQVPAAVRKAIGNTYQGFHMKLMLTEKGQYFTEFTHKGSNYQIVFDNTGHTIVSSKE